MRIVHIESVDTTNYSAGDAAGLKRPDTTRRLKRAHEAAAYDAWVRGQVQEALDDPGPGIPKERSEEHTSELQSLMRISYAAFCLKKKKKTTITQHIE